MLEQAIELYFNQQLSLKLVADKLNTYPNKIRRLIVDAGYSLRDKATSQVLALEKGRANHPTKGKRASPKTKSKISKSMVQVWDEKTVETKLNFSEKAKERWHGRTVAEHKDFAKKAALGVRNAGMFGSKIEQFLLAKFREHKFEPQYQRENLIFSERMRVDFFLPHDKLVVEIDGPTHYLPIWGEERLQEKIAYDDKKNGLLLYCGYHVIRVRVRRKTMTVNYKEYIWSKIYWTIDELCGVEKPRLIIIEIPDEPKQTRNIEHG